MLPTILLVEDSADDIFFMKRALKLAGVANPLQVVEDGQEAIHYLGGAGRYADRIAHPLPAIVLLDLRLPIVLGFDVLKWMREQAQLECLPVIVMTSSKEETDMQRAYSLGANSFVVKTGSTEELVGLVRTLALYWLKYNSTPASCLAEAL